MIRRWILNKLLRYLTEGIYTPLTQRQTEAVFTKMLQDEYLRTKYPKLLKQLADESRNKYLYTDDPMYKGMALAFVTLREQLDNFSKARQEKKQVKPERILPSKY